MTETQRKYLEWLEFNDYEIEEVETKIKNGEEPLVFESNQFYAWKGGYDKANEWHNLEKDPNDLPNKELEEKQLLVRVRNYTEDCFLAYYMIDKYYSNIGKRFYSDIACEYPIDIKNVIAWKEIVFPELKENE